MIFLFLLGDLTFCFSRYVTPNSKRALLKKVKSRKYQEKVQARAAYEAGRPTEPTFKVDETDVVFQTLESDEPKASVEPTGKKSKKGKKKTST